MSGLRSGSVLESLRPFYPGDFDKSAAVAQPLQYEPQVLERLGWAADIMLVTVVVMMMAAMSTPCCR